MILKQGDHVVDLCWGSPCPIFKTKMTFKQKHDNFGTVSIR